MLSVWLHMVSIACILLFSLYSTLFFVISRDVGMLVKIIAMIVFTATIVMMFRRDVYLPFLGYAAFPPSLIPNKDVVPEKADKEIELVLGTHVPNGTAVIYWGALPSNNVAQSPKLAYGNYSNMGVSHVKNGKVLVKFACPSQYKVRAGMKLNRHIHYRLCYPQHGLLSPVFTEYVRC